jgi:hypothetical protein
LIFNFKDSVIKKMLGVRVDQILDIQTYDLEGT